MSCLVFVLNGPNLDLLGKRQPHIYGHETLADVEHDCRALAEELKLDTRFHQVSKRADRIIAGFGTQGYTLALRRIAKLMDEKAA